MRGFIKILLGVCTVAGVVIVFIPMTGVMPIKWFVLSIIVAIVIILWLISIICKNRREENSEDTISNDKVYITDIQFVKRDIIIYFLKNQIYHVDALVCIYEDSIPDPKLVAVGKVMYCENRYTKIKVIKILDRECFKKFKNNRQEMDGKIFAITSFKEEYIDLLK